jgi:hypothetical protein
MDRACELTSRWIEPFDASTRLSINASSLLSIDPELRPPIDIAQGPWVDKLSAADPSGYVANEEVVR